MSGARIGHSSESISCGGEVVSAFGGLEQVADLADCLPEGVDGPDGFGAQMGFEFCEGHLDRIEVGAVGRQEEDLCALGPYGLLGGRAFVG